MVKLRIIGLVVVGICVTANTGEAAVCSALGLQGHVKSVIETETVQDPATGKAGPARVTDRIDISADGAVAEMTVYDRSRLAAPISKFTSYFESGRAVRGVEVVNGRTVSTTTCSYDAQGRLVEARTQSEHGERNIIEAYEYGPALIRRRVSAFGGPSIVTQTLDDAGRVAKEVVVDEATSTIRQTTEFTYDGARTEQCIVSSREPERRCVTSVRDARGNEIEIVTAGQSRRFSFEYDAVGNWISKRIVIAGPGGTTVDTVVQRKIEYW